MATNRDASKQKRARQNRAQREALKARTEAAGTPRPSRAAPSRSGGGSSRTNGASTKATGAKGANANGAEAPARGGFFSRGGQPRGPRPGDRPVDIETLEGNWYTKRLMVPGGRQVLTGFALTLVLAAMAVIFKYPDPDYQAPKGAKDEVGPATERLWDLFGWWSIVIVAVPLLLTGLAAQSVLWPRRRRVWIGTAIALTVITVFVFATPVYLFPAGFLVFASMKSSKVEGAGAAIADGEDEAVDPDESSDADDRDEGSSEDDD